MKRYALALLPLFAGVALIFSMGGPGYAQETYPAGTDSLTIYGLGMVGINASDTTQTDTDGSVNISTESGLNVQKIAVVRFPLDAIPSGKSIVKVMMHVTATNTKVMADRPEFNVDRLMQSYDSTAVTYADRSGSSQWPSSSIETWGSTELDNTYESTSYGVRPSVAVLMLPSGYSKASGVTIPMTGDVTGMVRAWYSGLWANHGVAIRYGHPFDGVTSYAQPVVSGSNGTDPPYLKVYYTDAGSGGGKVVQGPAPFGIR